MLITKDFIVLNNPKTGSTFLRTVLKAIHRNNVFYKIFFRIYDKLNQVFRLSIIELFFHQWFGVPKAVVYNTTNGIGTNFNPHGGWKEIPERFRNRPIVSGIRNPYDKFLSEYEYGWWKWEAPVNLSAMIHRLPSFPHFSLDEYLEFDYLLGQYLYKTITGEAKIDDLTIGRQTIRFIHMFFKDPATSLPKVNEHYIFSGEYKNDMIAIQFLRQENLKQELCDFLAGYGYTKRQLDYVKRFRRLNVSESQVTNRNSLWTEKSLNHVRNRERFLFKILQDQGIEYKEPTTAFLTKNH